MFQSLIYFYIVLDTYIEVFSIELGKKKEFIAKINAVLYKLFFLSNPVYTHLFVFMLILIVSFATFSKKEIKYNWTKHFTVPIVIGTIFYILSLYTIDNDMGMPLVTYSLPFVLGAVLLHVAFSNLSKKVWTKKDDIWNFEEESFPQNEKLVDTATSVNIPTTYYYNKKIRHGWMNINPFRGIMVIGVPGSGKSASILIPMIKQLLNKGFAAVIYDFKFPDLANVAWYHYNLNKAKGKLKDHKFYCVNIDNVELSYRCNPIAANYIKTLADASETAEAIISGLNREGKAAGGGSSQFFQQSAINFLASIIYFLSKYENGKFSTIPHLLAFVSMPYDAIFNTLFTNPELVSLLAPFKSAYDNKAFDQLEGQIGTVRVSIGKISTAESFWVFSGNDFDLKISNPASVLVLANSPDTQNINSAFFSAVLMRTTRLINSKGNNPSAIIVDECPTIFLHKVENLIATARSNKVAVALGLQELPQFNQQYGKEVAATITSIMGSVISGAVRSKETLDWLEKLFGKVKQESRGMNVDRTKNSLNINYRMDSVIPASRIANQNAGEVVGIVSREQDNPYGRDYSPNLFACKVNLDFKAISAEEALYKPLPKVYNFGDEKQKRDFLLKNMLKIYDDVRQITGQDTED